MSKIIITYPPDYDGELHIKAIPQLGGNLDKTIIAYRYEFVHTSHNGKLNELEVLVEAALAIIRQLAK